MTEPANCKRHYYAAQSPRGFANETQVHVFRSRAARDAWWEDHKSDGDVNSASCGAYRVTAKEARAIINYTGDSVTRSYNSVVHH